MQQQIVEVLVSALYAAAKIDAHQVVKLIVKAGGKPVFNSYKSRTPLPEDVATESGHHELAQYLRGVNRRSVIVVIER